MRGLSRVIQVLSSRLVLATALPLIDLLSALLRSVLQELRYTERPHRAMGPSRTDSEEYLSRCAPLHASSTETQLLGDLANRELAVGAGGGFRPQDNRQT